MQSRLVSQSRRALFVLFSACVAYATASPSAAQEGGGEGSYANGSHLLLTPAFLQPGSLDVHITGPGFDDSFGAEAVEHEAYPGSLLMQGTPYGDVVVFDHGDPVAPDYSLVFVDYGASTPLLPVGGSFTGNYAGLTLNVSTTPVLQEPPSYQFPGLVTISGSGGVEGHSDWSWIRFQFPEFGVRFQQFFTINVTWRGRRGSTDVSGTAPGSAPTTGNNGEPVRLDGSTTYVDSSRSMTGSNTRPGFNFAGPGDYPSESIGNGTSMNDTPNTLDPGADVNAIQAANPGVTVTELRIHMAFTTYVLRNNKVIHKIKWDAIEIIDIPAVTPHYPGPGFGGPIPGPNPPPFHGGGIPSSEQAGGMEPQHAAAMAAYLAGLYIGAPSVNGR